MAFRAIYGIRHAVRTAIRAKESFTARASTFWEVTNLPNFELGLQFLLQNQVKKGAVFEMCFGPTGRCNNLSYPIPFLWDAVQRRCVLVQYTVLRQLLRLQTALKLRS